MYTSGTTGRPKGVMLTHANLAWKNLAHIVEFGFTSADLGLACGPLYHVGALDLTTTSLIAAGATTIIHRAFDAADVVDEIERSRVTTVWLAPAMVNAIMALPDIEQRDLSSVRVIINGGEKMPIPLIERIQRDVPVGVVRRRLRPHRDRLRRHVPRPRQHRHASSAASAVRASTSSSTSGTTTARRCRAGERGEVVLRGPKVFKGYWRDPDATATAFAGGWFHTGDIGVRDDDGYLFIVDRLKDMIVSGGENIASSEVERVLYEHDVGARGGRRRAPRRALGRGAGRLRRRCAHGATTTADELVEHCRAQLAQFKVPKDVDVHRRAPAQPVGQGPQARAAQRTR